MDNENIEITKKHVGSVKPIDIFIDCFDSSEEAKQFCARVDDSQTNARIALNQTARMVWLADRIEEVAKGRPALQILFYLIAAEAVAKIFYNFSKEGESRQYVKKFFFDFCSENDKKKLGESIFFTIPEKLTLDTVLDILYDIRCDVAHRGEYYSISFPESGKLSQISTERFSQSSCYKERIVTISLTIHNLRLIILRTAKEACLRMVLEETVACSI